MSASDEVLARVRRYREAARVAVRTLGADDRDRCLALIEIADMARGEEDPTIRAWGERAIWEESRVFLGMDDREAALPPASFESRVRKLRTDGYVRCPTCSHELPTDDELERWARMRRDAAELRDRREAALG